MGNYVLDNRKIINLVISKYKYKLEDNMSKFELKDLGYEYNALEPTIDEETMRIHHGKHHNAYVTNLNKSLEGVELEKDCIVYLLKNVDKLPEDKRQAVINNGGGHYNHTLFWETMTPGGSSEPTGVLLEKINETFGSFEEFKTEFETKGAGQFGSGWAWLVLDKGKLKVTSTKNQDSPVMEGQKVLLGNDVWEHAYYLKYRNVRPDYLKAWWAVVNWDVVAKRYEKALDCGCKKDK